MSQCHKLESPCGDDPWGWCQECPKRAKQVERQYAAEGFAWADQKCPDIDYTLLDDQ